MKYDSLNKYVLRLFLKAWYSTRRSADHCARWRRRRWWRWWWWWWRRSECVDYLKFIVRDVEDGEAFEPDDDLGQLGQSQAWRVERRDGARVECRLRGHAREHRVPRVLCRQQQRVTGQVHVDDGLRHRQAGQRVAGHVEHPQRVQVVQVPRQRPQLVVAGQKHLQRAQLTYVRDERRQSVAGDVQHRQQLHAKCVTLLRRSHSSSSTGGASSSSLSAVD